jgi:hypothetical protein
VSQRDAPEERETAADDAPASRLLVRLVLLAVLGVGVALGAMLPFTARHASERPDTGADARDTPGNRSSRERAPARQGVPVRALPILPLVAVSLAELIRAGLGG